MTHYQPAQRVQVFDPQLRRYIEGGVVAATTGCVRVSLDDRMVPINVDPADHFSIQPIDVPSCTGCTSPLCPDCEPATHGAVRREPGRTRPHHHRSATAHSS